MSKDFRRSEISIFETNECIMPSPSNPISCFLSLKWIPVGFVTVSAQMGRLACRRRLLTSLVSRSGRKAILDEWWPKWIIDSIYWPCVAPGVANGPNVCTYS